MPHDYAAAAAITLFAMPSAAFDAFAAIAPPRPFSSPPLRRFRRRYAAARLFRHFLTPALMPL